MFLALTNTPRDYAWGSDSAISDLLGTTPTGRPEAELWLGTHEGSPARLQPPVSGVADLAEWVAANPRQALGRRERLPFLLKVLAAAKPLSLQAHPSPEQARAGFERENELGIPLDAGHRSYKDPYPKPEIIVALSDRFDALCGFRPLERTVRLLDLMGAPEIADRLRVGTPAALADTVRWLLSGDHRVRELLERVVATAGIAGTSIAGEDAPRDESYLRDTVRLLSEHFPGDPGILVALLLNRVTLARGEALYLPAGNIHAYLGGLGIELMTASDNVLRGGLTPKHVDVAELTSVLDFTSTPVPYLTPRPLAEGGESFAPAGVDFALVRFSGAATHSIDGPAIALCTAGEFTLTGAANSAVVRRGDAVFVTPDEARLRLDGEGELFLAVTA